ncbi:hypothetical protein WN944_017696 [Citrus x changshan-huyou]|uniref:Uncharacterized protein n=1 Tax=Citrus x changshan-huyou TaxID=2935761 RepID=A0AAP0MI32_9ROSI
MFPGSEPIDMQCSGNKIPKFKVKIFCTLENSMTACIASHVVTSQQSCGEIHSSTRVLEQNSN